MGFIERLRQEDTARASRDQQLKAQQEAQGRERLQRETSERERRENRRERAEKLRQESGVSDTVEELAKYLETPTIPVTRSSFSDGLHDSWTDHIGRGRRGISSEADLLKKIQRDPDSVYDTVSWDTENLGYSKAKVMGNNSLHSEKYIAVETCPDGTIVFHGGWRGSTTIEHTEWRAKDKKQLFDKALEKAYKNPGINRYSVWHEPVSPGCG